MRSVVPMKVAKIGVLLVCVLLCALGVVLLSGCEFSVRGFGIASGVTMMVFGGVRLGGYFSRDLFRLAFQYDRTLGILMLALGAAVLVHSQNGMGFLCVALGACVLTDGLFKIQIALDSKGFGIREWWLILTLAVLACAFGAALLLCPQHGAVFNRVMGLTLLLEGVLNFSTILTAVKIIKHQQPDERKTDFDESGE